MKILSADRIVPDGTPRSAALHLGYAVCLCPTKRTTVLNELILAFATSPCIFRCYVQEEEISSNLKCG